MHRGGGRDLGSAGEVAAGLGCGGKEEGVWGAPRRRQGSGVCREGGRGLGCAREEARVWGVQGEDESGVRQAGGRGLGSDGEVAGVLGCAGEEPGIWGQPGR